MLNKRFQKPTFLILHCYALTTSEMLKLLSDENLSVHYLIDEDGTIIHHTNEDLIAYHAGKSFWGGIENLNPYSIGIEIYNKSLGQTPYSEKQIQSLIRLSEKIIKKYPDITVLGHSDIAPNRKPDPGIFFPWEQLAQNGIGRWYNPQVLSPIKGIKTILTDIGYDTRTNEVYLDSICAFCRHFYPQAVPTKDDILKLLEKPNTLNIIPEDDNFLRILRSVHASFCPSKF